MIETEGLRGKNANDEGCGAGWEKKSVERKESAERKGRARAAGKCFPRLSPRSLALLPLSLELCVLK
jgi:hypothetical protein